MFVFSVRANKPKLIIILAALLAVLVIAFVMLGRADKPAVNDGGVSFKASNEGERLAFLSQFGWKVNEDPVEVSEVIIPGEFDDVYSAYNEIQKNQNLDLEIYKGERVKKWVYEVKNYPGYPADSGCIRATLLIYKGIVIGGDVSSIELGGFSQGFEYPQNSRSVSEAETSSATAAQ